MQAGLAVLVAVPVWFLSGGLADFYGVAALAPILRIAAIALIFLATLEFSKAALQGLERFNYLAIVTAVEFTGKIILALGLAWLGFGAVGAWLGYTVALAIAAGVATIIFFGIGLGRPSSDRGLWRDIFVYNLPLMVTTAGFIVYTELDNLNVPPP